MRSRALAFDGAKSAWPDLKILNEQKETAACDARARTRSSTALHCTTTSIFFPLLSFPFASLLSRFSLSLSLSFFSFFLA